MKFTLSWLREHLDTTADAHAVTLDPADSETIAGASTHAAIDAANDTALFQSTGAAWVLVDSSIA